MKRSIRLRRRGTRRSPLEAVWLAGQTPARALSDPLSLPLTVAFFLMTAITTPAEEWRAFRGSSATAISSETGLALHWSDSENLAWKAELPGPGASSPVITGGRVFITAYSGYGVQRRKPGRVEDLRRHVLCFEAATGRALWASVVEATSRADVFQGVLANHGYASSTPVTDGVRLYLFFGKTGVLAFDLEGAELWRTNVGVGSSLGKAGSGASLALHGDLVIVNASDESQSIRALNKSTGEEVWKADSPDLDLAFGTPSLVELPGGRTDMVITMPFGVWALNPDSGELRWSVRTEQTHGLVPGIVWDRETLYVFGGSGRVGGYAIRAGGIGDVTDSHLVWTTRHRPNVPTPVLYKGHLYWVDERGIAFCLSASTGELVNRSRIQGEFYASPVVAEDRLYAVSRDNGAYVLEANPGLRVISHNKFESDETRFEATPAICEARIYLRSRKALYCIERSIPIPRL